MDYMFNGSQLPVCNILERGMETFWKLFDNFWILSRKKSKQLRILILHCNLFKVFLFTSSQEVPISLKSSLMILSRPSWRLYAFCLALDGSLKITVLGNVSSFFHRTCPSHLNLFLIIALEKGIGSHFSYSFLIQIRSVRCAPKTIHNQILGRVKQTNQPNINLNQAK